MIAWLIHFKRKIRILFASLWALLFADTTIMEKLGPYEVEAKFLKKNNNSCFVYVSDELMKNGQRKLNSENVHGKFLIVKNNRFFYATLKGHECETSNNVYLDKKYADILNVKEKDTLRLTFILEASLKPLNKVYFHTSPEDYVKMNACSDKLETTIQRQVTFVSKNSKIPISINDHNISVTFSIHKLEPDLEFGLLKDNTELHYEPANLIEEKTVHNTMFEGLVRNHFHSKQSCNVTDFAHQPKYARICSLDSLKLDIPEQFQMVKHAACVYVKKMLESHQIFKNQKGTSPVLVFQQIIFKNDAETNAEFCSYIYELDEIQNALQIFKNKQEIVRKDEDEEDKTSLDKNVLTKTHESNSNSSFDKLESESMDCMKVTGEDEINSKTDENQTENGRTTDTDDCDTDSVFGCEENDDTRLINQVFSQDDLYEPLLLVYMDQQVLKDLNLKVGTKFKISNYKENRQCRKVILHVTSAEMRSKQLKPRDIEDEFARLNRLGSSKYFILNTNSILNLKVNSQTIQVRIELVPCNVKYTLYDGKIKLEVVLDKSKSGNRRPVDLDSTIETHSQWPIPSETNNTPASTENIFLNHLNDTLCSILAQIRASLTTYHIYQDNILVIGPEGCGKTTLCTAIQERLSNGPDSIHCEVVDCKTMKNRISNLIEKSLRDILSKASYMEPACVVLDDIEVLCSNNKDSLDANATVHSNKICSLFVSLVREFQHNSNLIILGVTSSKDLIKSTKAGLVFSHCFTLPSLDLNSRSLLLEKLLQSKLFPKYFDRARLDLDKLSKQCEGYSLQDMCDVVDKALFHYRQNMDPFDSKSPSTQEPVQPISDQDLEVAFHSHVPLAMKGINVDSVEKISFGDVGGLKGAKQLLIETLVWPSMYPDLFSQCPLKPQSGILLYGAPGTGKTLLASAISGECGLKFISIKGPELFSKFIGESEEGVRNIFNRARSIKPCILFFDEFDSLAAKRGNDSTGVKDRVVNQLLTELDGVEGLDGVYVVGATSRPDIIDPALLRPGRLGASVHCTMPDMQEREEILSVLIRKTKRNADLDLSEIARQTERFTGADLLGVLCSAQMIRQDKEESEEDPEITQADLLEALEDAKPSLAPLDSFKYEKIYHDFANSKGLSIEDMKKQRVISA